MNKISKVLVAVIFLATTAFAAITTKLVSKDAHISFFSHTAVEDITASNYKTVSTIETSTGEIVFSVPMQSFEFEKALMQKHFNSKDFLDTKQFPKAKFVGKITNLSDINFSKDGVYNATVVGELTIKEISKPLTSNGTLTIAAGKVTAVSKFTIKLSDFNISFVKGKPSTNIAKTVEVTLTSLYQPE